MTGLRERQKDARRRIILEQASTLFRQQGYSETTVEQIAARANVSPATVFNYFPSKGDMLLGIVAQADERYLARLGPRLTDPRLPAVDAITDLLVTIARESLDVLNRDAWRHVLATVLQSREERFIRAYRAVNERLLAVMRNLIEVLQERGELAPHIAPKAAAQLLFNLDETLFAKLVADETRSLDDYRDETRAQLRLVLTGIGVPEPRPCEGGGYLNGSSRSRSS